MAARLGGVIDERHKAQYRELRAADLVNRCTARPMPFGYTVNPYRGCSTGCVYCYARYTHEFLGHNDPHEFERTIYVKRVDGATLRRSLERARRSGMLVAVGTATDPYQAGEGGFEVTRGLLEAVRALPGIRLSITTKGTLVTRDLDLLRAIAERSELSVNFSVTTTDAELARLLEPRAPRPDLRLAAMQRLAEAGLATRLFMMPVLPYLTDGDASIGALLQAARAAGLVARYRALYSSSAYVPPAFARTIEARFARLAGANGLAGRRRADRPDEQGPPARQLALAW